MGAPEKRYLDEPDFSRPPSEVPPQTRERFLGRLGFLYGERNALAWMPELERIISVHCAHKSQQLIESEQDLNPAERFSEKDVFLITYGDIVRGEGDSPLAVLAGFIDDYYSSAFNTIHILPFFPYSSDRGFSVIDFRVVDPNLGDWKDIENLGDRYKLMFDGVLNHVSSKSAMFQGFLNCHPDFKEFFISYSSPDDLPQDQRKNIFRPRTSDILTEVLTLEGQKYVWTTFSEDQIDLDFRNPRVLMWLLDVLLLYVRKGATALRLDAVTFIWKEPGTICVHLPETHEVVKFIRDVMDMAAPGVALVTETNVPHKDNISYFGEGHDEAHMVYNFTLPPLVLHTFYTGNAEALSEWAQILETGSDTATFFNMLDTHDGIGLMGVKELLSEEEIDFIIQQAKENGACISYKTGASGVDEPYEINTTWFSALNSGDDAEGLSLKVRRFIASRSIALALPGVPATYIHSLTGTVNDQETVEKTGSNRDINRGDIDANEVAARVKDPKSKFSLICNYLARLHAARMGERAFHPNGEQLVLMVSPSVFAILRTSPEGDRHVLALTNVTASLHKMSISLSEIGIEEGRWRDLFSEKDFATKNDIMTIDMQPYEVIWLKPKNEI